MTASRPSDVVAEEGLVVASHGQRVLVEDRLGASRSCLVPRRVGRVVCGDRVVWTPTDEGAAGAIRQRLPRRTRLQRPDRRGRAELLAANVDQLVVVVAPTPPADLGLVDRYLAAARLGGLSAVVLRNKSDLADAKLDDSLADYRRIGYSLLSASAREPSGLAPLLVELRDRISILVGQSGVGKSSLLNALVPDAAARTERLSAATGEGRHTTTASVLHHLEQGGALIDSPGVRDYSPPPLPADEVARGFVEIDAVTADCRFSDCRHLQEPDCAVKRAVAAGRISERRYRSYRELFERMRELAPPPGG